MTDKEIFDEQYDEIKRLSSSLEELQKELEYYKNLSEKAHVVIESAKKEPEFSLKSGTWNDWKRVSWNPAIKEYESLKVKPNH